MPRREQKLGKRVWRRRWWLLTVLATACSASQPDDQGPRSNSEPTLTPIERRELADAQRALDTETPQNGQTGSLDISECSFGNDIDCTPALGHWNDPDYEIELVGASCEHEFDGSSERMEAPQCICRYTDRRMGILPSVGEVRLSGGGSFALGTRSVGSEWLGNSQCSASLRNTPQECAYCASDFPGCNVDVGDDECQESCQDAIAKVRAQNTQNHEVELRLAQCTPNGRCESVLRIDDQCSNQDNTIVSCELSDEQIVNAPSQDRPRPGSGCSQAEFECESASDCPRGLACDGSVCGPCASQGNCYVVDDENGVGTSCLGDGFRCATDEVCGMGTCLLEANSECLSGFDCPSAGRQQDRRVCLLSGLDQLTPRGNAQTRSYCTTPMPNCYGLQMGDELKLRVLAADSMPDFDPPINAFRVACDLPAITEEGSTHTFTVLGLEEETPCMRATIAEASAEGTALSPQVSYHPRDAAEGRLETTLSNAPGNWTLLANSSQVRVNLNGCDGLLQYNIYSLLLPPEESLEAQQTGSIPGSVLSYVFRNSGSASTTCEVPPGTACSGDLPVELTRTFD